MVALFGAEIEALSIFVEILEDSEAAGELVLKALHVLKRVSHGNPEVCVTQVKFTRGACGAHRFIKYTLFYFKFLFIALPPFQVKCLISI